MRHVFSLLWPGRRTIGRLAYLLTGLGLFAVKFVIDGSIAAGVFGQSWSALNYLIWPNDGAWRGFDMTDPQRNLALTMLGVSLPFIGAGVLLTLQRLRSAGLPAGLVLLFFVPLVNLLFFLVLVLLPARTQLAERRSAAEGVMSEELFYRRLVTLRGAHQRLVGNSYWKSGLVALLVTVPLSVLLVVCGAEFFGNYGMSLFVGGPFALGMISVLLLGFSRPQQNFGACLAVALSSAFVAACSLLALGIEGIICLIMAVPPVFLLASLGALVGYSIQLRPWLNDQMFTVGLAVLLVLPCLMAAEATNEPEPEVRAVRSEVIVEAAPEEVWPLVIAFEPLPEPDDWFFRTGVAYPQRAEIRGSGVGAVRYCVFSTGAFVEPIEEWRPPTLLAFRVTQQPEPLREWSPYAIHPPHLDNYLVSKRGQFRLERLEDGRTRLEGTTWYSNRMWPAEYWGLCSDYIIHRIHLRVLTHIQKLALPQK